MKTIAIIILTATLFIGCSSNNYRPAPVNDQPQPHKKNQINPPTKMAITKPIPQSSYSNSNVRETLLEHYDNWKGVTYKYGGLSKRGIDCSGFVYLTYRDLFDTNVPRSTKLLASTGSKIRSSQLRPGDLVLYKTSRTVRHAGIYIGNNRFLHASKSKGVMVSDMGLDYWRNRYWQARRVL
ncbi:MAG: glycoside hydrolase [Gammaproteobacteria bacterium]|nr:MAG: glycoside hydrolase [Gammaproteobacteria bacterium]